MEKGRFYADLGIGGKVIISGDHRLYVENHKGMYKYKEAEIWLGYEHGGLKIEGRDLRLREINNNYVEILGKVDRISLEEKEW